MRGTSWLCLDSGGHGDGQVMVKCGCQVWCQLIVPSVWWPGVVANRDNTFVEFVIPHCNKSLYIYVSNCDFCIFSFFNVKCFRVR